MNVEERRQLPPSLYGSRTSGSIGRALMVGLRTTQARGDDASELETSPGRAIYRLDEYEVRKKAFCTSLEKWGVCVVAPMPNPERTQVDALGLSGIEGGTDLILALKLLSERYKCNRMEVVERYFPEVHRHLLNNRTATVATNLGDFRLLMEANDRKLDLYTPVYDGLVLGALAQPGWMSGLTELTGRDTLADLGGAALSFGYFRHQAFPCDLEAWNRSFPEEARPLFRDRSVICDWPDARRPEKGFSTSQKRWVVLSLRAATMSTLEVVQTTMRRTSREKPVEFLWHGVQKALMSIYPYNPALTLTSEQMREREREPRGRVTPRTRNQEVEGERAFRRWQREDDALIANWVQREKVSVIEHEGRRRLRVALNEAPSAIGYDPDAPPLDVCGRPCIDVRDRLGPPVEAEPRVTKDLVPEASEVSSEMTVQPPPRHGQLIRSLQKGKAQGQMADSVAAQTLARRTRRTLKRYFTAITTALTAKYPTTFLGPMLCHQCGGKTHGDDVCWVTVWREGGALPRHRTMPCRYCRSRRHAVDACSYLHHRCSQCGLLGHVRAECQDYGRETWKKQFLESAQFGVLTGRNPYGPVRGRFGLGEECETTEGKRLTQSVRQQIEATAEREGWLMDGSQGFKDAVVAKRKEDYPFDLWWRGVLEEEDINKMKQRIGQRPPSAEGGKRASSTGSSSEAKRGRKPGGVEAKRGRKPGSRTRK